MFAGLQSCDMFAACRSVGMLQARSTVGGIFSDLGLEADSLNRLKVRHAVVMPIGGARGAAT